MSGVGVLVGIGLFGVALLGVLPGFRAFIGRRSADQLAARLRGRRLRGRPWGAAGARRRSGRHADRLDPQSGSGRRVARIAAAVGRSRR